MSRNTLIVIATILGLAIVWVLVSTITQDRPSLTAPEQTEQVEQLTPGDSEEEIDQDMEMLEEDMMRMEAEMEETMLQMEAEMEAEFGTE